MSQTATGTFDVNVTPQPAENDALKSAKLDRALLEKQFHGDLEATSTGELLGTFTEVKGSAGYVAIERVTGTLKGRKGTFALIHKGTMNRGAMESDITVVPDSGTEDLKGLNGSMKIIIEGGKHSYEFDYSMAAE